MGASFAVSMHTGQVYVGGSATAPLIPGGAAAAGWIPDNLGESSAQSATTTKNFLTGGSGTVSACLVLCVTANKSYGGPTAIEVGAGIKAPAKGVSGSTGVMTPWFKLPFTPGDKNLK